jgi:hydrogenase expression/formation protein HypE
MRRHPLGRHAAIVGTIADQHPGFVSLRTSIGGERMLALLSGEQLPRIC